MNMYDGKGFPSTLNRIPLNNLELIRQSIFLDNKEHPIPMNQVMPKYIPMEPTKGCVVSPLGQSRMSSRAGSVMLSELDSDVCSSITQTSSLVITQKSSPLSHGQTSQNVSKSVRRKTKSKMRKRTKAKQRPVNVVGPIVSSLGTEEREDLLSGSGGESIESEGDHNKLREEVIAQGKLITKLEEDLSGQLKVNAELKKLLVASVGNDLEYRVEKLAQDKAQLSATVGSYSQKMYKDFEDLDRISIQADMWKSKYMASRVQSEELEQTKISLMQRYTEASSALERMLEERQTINNNLQLAHRLLECVHSSSEVLSKSLPFVSKPTLQLSDDLLAIANQIASSSPTCNAAAYRNVSEAPLPTYNISKEQLSGPESAAYSVLSDQLIPPTVLEVPHNDDIPRSSILCHMLPSKKKEPKIMVV